jgi:hypothetical protein
VFDDDPDVAAAMTGQLDYAIAEARVELRFAVQKQITDNKTGALLDVERAVLVHITSPDATRHGAMEVFDAQRWDEVGPQMAATVAGLDLDLRIVDGRELWPRGARA